MIEPASWTEIEEFLETIKEETCGGTQPRFLYELAINSREQEGEIVEIGTNVGRSAIVFGFAQKEKRGKPIHSVDIYKHKDIESNLTKAGVIDLVKLHVGSSSLVAKSWRVPLKLLWIDGDHCAYGVERDIRAWCRFVCIGGKVAFHDYPGHKRSMQVWKALKKTLLRNPYEWRMVSDRQAGSIVVFERLAETGPSIRWSSRLKQRIFWRFRNLRALAIRFMPRLASRAAQRLKAS